MCIFWPYSFEKYGHLILKGSLKAFTGGEAFFSIEHCQSTLNGHSNVIWPVDGAISRLISILYCRDLYWEISKIPNLLWIKTMTFQRNILQNVEKLLHEATRNYTLWHYCPYCIHISPIVMISPYKIHQKWVIWTVLMIPVQDHHVKFHVFYCTVRKKVKLEEKSRYNLLKFHYISSY